MQVEGTPGKIKITWLLDSGCTNHIINKDVYFSNYIMLKNQTK